MYIKKDFSTKLLEKAGVGELVQTELFGQMSLAIVLKKFEDDDLLYGILDAPGSGAVAPFYLKADAYGRCLSFGDSWELELLRTTATRFGSDPNGSEGVVLVSGDDVFMKFAEPPKTIGKGSLYYDFTSMQVSSPPTKGVRIASWKIWRTKEDARSESVKPIFEFTVKIGE